MVESINSLWHLCLFMRTRESIKCDLVFLNKYMYLYFAKCYFQNVIQNKHRMFWLFFNNLQFFIFWNANHLCGACSSIFELYYDIY